MVARKLVVSFIVVSLTLLFTATAALAETKNPPSGEGNRESANRPIAAIHISFKVSAITPENFYMGEVWTYTIREAQVGEKTTIEAKAVGLDAQGNQVDINPAWKAGDPAMIDIFPGQGVRVRLTILKDGKSDIMVAFKGISKKLPLKAWHRDKVMYVEITQSR